MIEQLGRGGMGTVYKAVDETLDRRVALKLLNADLIDQDAVERFRREALMLAKLNHGRIGAIHELSRNGHDLLMVMEYLEGETFEKLIERGPMEVPRAISLVSQVLDALDYAHGAGVIHRDLKPANLMLSPSGEVKVMDFGIARVQGSEHLTTNGYMVGTPAYMAPEQVRGEEVDPRMDLYSVAVVLYRMLTRHLPFKGDTAIAMIHSQLNNPPTPAQQFRADLPEWLVAALERGLAKKPADRFQTAREFRAALEKGLTGKTGKTAIVRSPGSPSPTRSLPLPPATRNIPGLGGARGCADPSGERFGGLSARARTDGWRRCAAGVAGHATVTLKPRHLATAAILVVALVIGGGILAFVALRRPATIVVPAPSTTAQTATASDAPPAATSTAIATEPAPVTTPPAATPQTSATPTAPPSSAPPASSASRPAPSSSLPSPSTSAARGGGRGTNSSAASTSRRTRRNRRGARGSRS